MKTIIDKITHIAAIFSMLMICSCADDFPYRFGEIPEGEGALTATVTFTPISVANLGTRTAGNAIQKINSLSVLVYTTEGKLVKSYSASDLPGYTCTPDGYKVTPNTDHLDGDEAHTDETTTPQAKFSLPNLPYGRYRIYAVANVPNLLTAPEYSEAIKTAEGLKGIKFDWNPNKIEDNNQMFGTFGQKLSSNDSDLEDTDPIVEFTKENAEIHAWIRRLASKVTVAYDASGLYSNVWIYIKNVTIHDIPAVCTLGDGNKITEEENLLNRRTNNQPDFDYTPDTPNTRIDYTKDYPASEHIYNTDQPGIELYSGLTTSQGEPIIMPKGDPHGPTAESLFFYENNQGDFQGQEKYNKQQQRPKYDENGNKINDGVGDNVREPEINNADGSIKNDYKDRVEHGTYIEVEAYYVSANSDNPSEGNIKYRFMLGKNVTYNYNAQRNYHFKVTLGFKGWANEPDWHIDFEEPEPSIQVPPDFRISYLYHEKSMLPIKLAGNCIGLTVTIEENNWAPYQRNAESSDPINQVPPATISATAGEDPLYEFKWNRAAYFDSQLDGVAKPYLGFLALQMPANYATQTAIPTHEIGEGNNKRTVIYDFNSRLEAQEALRDDYYNKSQNIREFSEEQLRVRDGSYDTGSPNEYYVNQVPEDKNQSILMLPLWTRARTMIEGSGFSGNNPYEYFERKARIKIVGKFRVNNPDGTIGEIELPAEYVNIFQVPRIVNPKGIWKSADSGDKTFRVKLKSAISPNGMSNFKNLTSQGDWSARVEAGSAVSLSKSAGTIGEIEGSGSEAVIKGTTGTEVDFNINFTEGTGYAIVNVLYHGNNCVHKIFVRKGFDQMVNMGGNDWSSFSLYATQPRTNPNEYTAILTANPLALGSYFRRGKLDNAILVQNNNGEEYSGFSPLQAPDGHAFLIYNRTNPDSPIKRNWTTIGYEREFAELDGNYDYSFVKSMGKFFSEDGSIEYQVPELSDFQALASTSNNYQFGYGVLYGEGATEPADEATVAYRLFDVKNIIPSSACGMRGVIVYDPDDGDQIFFPVGAFGMGRRTQFVNPSTAYNGTLRYADVYRVLEGSTPADNNNCFRPVAYNLPIAPGAIYWIDKWEPTGHVEGGRDYPSMGWDINYFNYDFNSYTQNNRRDACVIKLIRKKTN